MAMARKKFWFAAGLLAVAVVPVLLVEGIRIVVFTHGSEERYSLEDRAMLVRTEAMGDIAEAIFRYQLQNHEPLKHVQVVFLELDTFDGGRDLSEEFMKRFAGHTPPVKPVSAAGYDEKNDSAVMDKETGKYGVILSIWSDETVWKNAGEVEVAAEYHFAGAAAAGYIYTVKRKGGKWVVVGAKLYMVS